MYGQLESASLLQIATRSDVFLVDMQVLNESKEFDWSRLTEAFFANADLLKLGFGLGHDLDVVQRAMPGCQDLEKR
jgi:hypothetical protein